MHLKRQLVLSLFALHSVAALAGQTRPAVPRYDLAIVGGRLIDGTGAPARRADLAIAGGAIAAIGTVNRQDAREIIDATNLAVAPGFIDVHTHADDLADHPRAENFVRMGVTTIVAGTAVVRRSMSGRR